MADNRPHFLRILKTLLLFFLSLSTVMILFALYAVFRLFIFDIEARDFDLYEQFKSKVAEVEEYKIQHTVYPNKLSDVSSEKICSRKYISFCTNIKYRTVAANTGFRMAAKSLSWPIFYYHSDYPETVKYAHWAQASTEAAREGYFPVYKKTPPIFENPEEWPDL